MQVDTQKKERIMTAESVSATQPGTQSTDQSTYQSAHQSTQGKFKFISQATESSLFRNDQVMIQRDADGNTALVKGVTMEPETLAVYNARTMGQHQPSCEKNGFELLNSPLLDDSLDLLNHSAVVEHYYAQCEALVGGITGCRAYAFDHNVRSAKGKKDGERLAAGQDVQGPAHVVHGDYTLRSGPDRLQQLAHPPSGNDTLTGYLAENTALIPQQLVAKAVASSQRFAIINVWRNISDQPVQTYPMALCDAQTVQPEELVVFEIHYTDRIGENYFSKFSPQHRMYYYPEMTRDEALVIKQWDSAGALARSGGAQPDASEPDAPCTFSFHSAFVDPDTASDAPDRCSIEVRCMVIYD
ncbi:MAG: hypothetical protein ACI9WS_003193 [Paraglaciecola psychrophila]|jgi:hypothetical protein